MLTSKEVKELRELFVAFRKPIFFFHDDPDGACSFIQAYKQVGEGKGHIVKATPCIDESYVRFVEESGADAVFIFDIAIVEQEFIDTIKVPVIWIDHHDPLKRTNVKYFNPRIRGENLPPSYLLYQVFEANLWISVVGTVGDWFVPPNLDDFKKKYPDLVGKKTKTPEDLLFDSPIGTLAHIISFNLKGSSRDAMNSVKVLTRIDSPYEILNQETARGRYIWKKYEKVKNEYDKLKELAVKSIKKDKLFFFTYSDDKMALTKDLSNELSHLYPDKVIVLAREKSGEMKTSLRTGNKGPVINKAVAKAVSGLQGSAGGHEHACGANIKKEDFEEFLDSLKKELKI